MAAGWCVHGQAVWLHSSKGCVAVDHMLIETHGSCGPAASRTHHGFATRSSFSSRHHVCCSHPEVCCPCMPLSAHPLQEPSSSSSWRPLAARARRLLLQGFLAAYPYLAGGVEASKFACQLLYLLEVAPVHHPLLALLGQRIVRVSGAEMVGRRGHRGQGGRWRSGCWCGCPLVSVALPVLSNGQTVLVLLQGMVTALAECGDLS